MSTSPGPEHPRFDARATAAALAVAVALVVPVANGDSAPARTTTVTLTASGTVQAPRQLTLGFTDPGRLTAIDVAPGQHVARGQVLALLDSRSAASAVATADANLASARA